MFYPKTPRLHTWPLPRPRLAAIYEIGVYIELVISLSSAGELNNAALCHLVYSLSVEALALIILTKKM